MKILSTFLAIASLPFVTDGQAASCEDIWNNFMQCSAGSSSARATVASRHIIDFCAGGGGVIAAAQMLQEERLDEPCVPSPASSPCATPRSMQSCVSSAKEESHGTCDETNDQLQTILAQLTCLSKSVYALNTKVEKIECATERPHAVRKHHKRRRMCLPISCPPVSPPCPPASPCSLACPSPIGSPPASPVCPPVVVCPPVEVAPTPVICPPVDVCPTVPTNTIHVRVALSIDLRDCPALDRLLCQGRR